MTALEFAADFVSEIVKDKLETLELIFDELPSNPKSALYELFIADNTVLPWVLHSECPDVRRVDGYDYDEGNVSIYKILEQYIMETYDYHTYSSKWDFAVPKTIMVPKTTWVVKNG